jgi:RNA polymerase sigma factor (sigma-70 family)
MDYFDTASFVYNILSVSNVLPIERHNGDDLKLKQRPSDREAALHDAIDGHEKRLLAFIGRRIRDEVEAKDISQEVFVEFLAAYDVGVAIESLGAWLVRVAQNKIIDRFRRKKTEAEYREEALEIEEQIAANDFEVREAILAALGSLPQEQRDVFMKHELEGKSFEEIAKESGENINTLLSRKRYAVLTLRELLKEVYDELE